LTRYCIYSFLPASRVEEAVEDLKASPSKDLVCFIRGENTLPCEIWHDLQVFFLVQKSGYDKQNLPGLNQKGAGEEF
jgi:hypothetical protein